MIENTEVGDEALLTQTFNKIMELRCNKNYLIDNIRFFEIEENNNYYAVANICFDWELNGCTKHVSFPDALFVKVGNAWQFCN